jgi:hypothetical protein
MAVMAFKKLCKKMKRLRKLRNRGRRAGHHLTQLDLAMRKSQSDVNTVVMGKSVMDPSILTRKKSTEDEIGTSSNFVSVLTKQKSARRGMKSHEEVYRDVSRQLTTYARTSHVDHASDLSEKLNILAVMEDIENKPSRPTRSSNGNINNSVTGSSKAAHSLFKNTYFQQFAVVPTEDQADETNGHISVGEYIPGSSIYFGATLALQARHGGFLSYASQEVKASAHKITSHSRFVVKKSDDFTNIGAICYGDALWLQAGTTAVLGASYGSLVDQKRAIQPALISCKRQNMFKANQYGRWIILNRDNPMGTLGSTVSHLDRIILEQEWYFLASCSPYESSMFKSLNNSDEAMTTKMDLFRPSEDCVWKIHLVDLPMDDRPDERSRQQLLQDAKDQINRSEELRYKKADILLKSFSDTLPSRLQDEIFVGNALPHKQSKKAEQQYFVNLYRKASEKGFVAKGSSVEFLGKIYGRESSITKLRAETMASNKPRERSKSPEHNRPATFVTTSSEEVDNDAPTSLEVLEEKYWGQAQKVLVNTKVWSQLPNRMEEFENKDSDRKLHAVQILQRSVKRYINNKFNFSRAMKSVDDKARAKLEAREIQRRRLLMEHSVTTDLTKKELNKNQPSDPRLTSTLSTSRLSENTAKTICRTASIVSISHSPTRSPSLRDNVLAAVVQDFINAPIATSQKVLGRSRSVSFLMHDREICLSANSSNGSCLEDVPQQQLARPQSASVIQSTAPRAVLNRPSTAFAALRMTSPLELQKNLLMRSNDREYGLPEDVFENMKDKTNVGVGLKFLRAMSTQPDLFTDLTAKKRKGTKPPKIKKISKVNTWNPVNSKSSSR